MTTHSKRPHILALAAALGLLCASATGCTSDPGTRIAPQQMEVSSRAVEESYDISRIDDAAIQSIARSYRQNGGESLDLTVTYNPGARDFTALRARQKLAEITGALRENGVKDIDARILPVHDAAMAPQLLIDYTSYMAHAPVDCALMAGLEDRNPEVNEDYRLGCSVETMMARQVANPRDLLGQSGDEEELYTDGRRQSNIVDLYRTGQQNSPLGGESASGRN